MSLKDSFFEKVKRKTNEDEINNLKDLGVLTQFENFTYKTIEKRNNMYNIFKQVPNNNVIVVDVYEMFDQVEGLINKGFENALDPILEDMSNQFEKLIFSYYENVAIQKKGQPILLGRPSVLL